MNINKALQEHPTLADQRDSYGWISIALHWLIAIAVILVWFVGQSISTQELDAIAGRRSLHILMGLILWFPLLIRIVWRFRQRHPRVRGQSDSTHAMAKLAHYTLLVLLGLMLITGPINAWFTPGLPLATVAQTIHGQAAVGLAALVVLHVLAAMKHLMFHDDETIARIFVPRKNGDGNRVK